MLFIRSEPHSGESSNNGEVQPIHPDVVHASDLERAIEYAVFNEIPTQNVLDSDRINTLYNFFGVIAKYAPVRKEIKQFLVSLREWPVQQKLRNIDSEDFTDKVRILALPVYFVRQSRAVMN